MNPIKTITLYHLMIKNQKMIGLKFYPDKLIQRLIKGLPNPKWSKQYGMVYITNTKNNLGIINDTFKGIVWLNYNLFLSNKSIHTNNESVDVSWFRKRKHIDGHKL